MKNLITLSLLALLSFNVTAADTKKAPVKKEAAAPTIKPQVKRPCKVGQTAEKDSCREVKKLK